MGLKQKFKNWKKEKDDTNRYYKQGYRASNLHLSDSVKNEIDSRRERLQRKAEYHSQKGQDLNQNARQFNHGDSDSGLAAINSLRHRVLAHYYEKKLYNGSLDKAAIKLHRREGGSMQKVEQE